MSLHFMIVESTLACKGFGTHFTLNSVLIFAMEQFLMQFSSFCSCEYFIAGSTCSIISLLDFFNIFIQLYISFFIKFSEVNFTELAGAVKDMVMNLMI